MVKKTEQTLYKYNYLINIYTCYTLSSESND